MNFLELLKLAVPETIVVLTALFVLAADLVAYGVIRYVLTREMARTASR